MKIIFTIFFYFQQIKDLVEAHDRPPQLGLQTAKNVALARTLVAEGKVT